MSPGVFNQEEYTFRYGDGRTDSRSCRAFGSGCTLTFTLCLPRREGATEVFVELYDAHRNTTDRIPMQWRHTAGGADFYTAELHTADCGCGLYYARPVLEEGGRLRYGSVSRESVRFSDDASGDALQLTLTDFSYPAPDWLCGGVIYQIFVDRFFRGAETPLSPGAVINPDWEEGIPQYPAYPGAPLENNMFFGGNLDGIIRKLDYIASLGTTCLYLSPIFKAKSNHKYDTGDYMQIDPMFGTEADLRRLIREASAHGMRVILDGVFNHTGDDSLYFNRYGTYPGTGAYQSQESPYYEWYTFQQFPDRYTCWWNIPILPRISPDVPSCREFFTGPGGVIAHYADMGIGGLRLDVADELSDDFISAIKARLNERVPDAVLYGEVWEDASNKIAYGVRKRYFLGRELDGVMNYPLRTGLISYFRDGDCRPLMQYFTDIMPNTPPRILNAQMNLLGTHDTVRILTALGGRNADGMTNDQLAVLRMSEDERKEAKKRLAAAYLVLATLPGIPSIFYGDEAGLEGYSDPFNRRPMPWHALQEDLLCWYRQVGEMRRRFPVYREGAFRLLRLDREGLLFIREEEGCALLTAVNRGSRSLSCSVPAASECVLGGGVLHASRLVLAPGEAGVWRLNRKEIKDTEESNHAT